MGFWAIVQNRTTGLEFCPALQISIDTPKANTASESPYLSVGEWGASQFS
ncbi:MAG: hypothetical protein J7641_00565 [Cyanobacteria bacterium SID2]|nr:hypothetical protein [Cyanobacteria bacterium SID2]